jgi:hypothetical protein
MLTTVFVSGGESKLTAGLKSGSSNRTAVWYTGNSNYTELVIVKNLKGFLFSERNNYLKNLNLPLGELLSRTKRP